MRKPQSKTSPSRSRAVLRSVLELSHEEISRVAYALWEQEGHPEGRAEEHWLQAEAQLRQERGVSPVSPQPNPSP